MYQSSDLPLEVSQFDTEYHRTIAIRLQIVRMTRNEIATAVVHAAFVVHRELGAGLLESVYERALMHELHLSGLSVRSQVPIDVAYKDKRLGVGFRLDILVENQIVIEVKSVSDLMDIHFAQLLTYLRLTELRLGLLINFNVPLIKDGIRRVVNGH